MIEFIMQPWPWYVAGPGIAVVTFFLYYYGKKFGVSSNFESMCTMVGAGKYSDYFKVDWKKDAWNLIFMVGAAVGGFIAAFGLSSELSVAINP